MERGSLCGMQALKPQHKMGVRRAVGAEYQVHGMEGNLFLYFRLYERVKLRSVCRLWKTCLDEDSRLWADVCLHSLGPAPHNDRVPPMFEYLVKTHGRHMLHLDTCGAHLPSVSLKYIGQYCFKLESLYIDEMQFNREEVLGSQMRIKDSSLRWLYGCKNLKSFGANRCAFLTDDGVKTLTEAVPSLVEIFLGCSAITDTGTTLLTRKFKDVQTLDFSTADITDATLYSVSKYCKKLKTLNLYRCKNITDKGLQSVIDECPGLNDLVVAHCPELTNNTMMTLAEACSENTLINFLDIGYNPNITDQGIEHFATECGDHLDYLDISYCTSVTHVGVELVLAECGNLRHLLCDGIHVAPYVHKMEANSPPLTVLSMQNCGSIADDAVSALASGCPDLYALHMRGCAIKGFRHLACGVLFSKFQSLHSLDLSYCKLADESLCFLQHSHTPLYEFILDGNTELTDQGVSYALAGCGKSLERLTLQFCDVTDQTLNNIASMASLLDFLDIRSCVKVTDAGIGALLNGCRILQTIKAGIAPCFGAYRSSSDCLMSTRSSRDDGVVGLAKFRASTRATDPSVKEEKSSSRRRRQKRKNKRVDEMAKMASQQSMKLGNKAMEALADPGSQLKLLDLDKNPRIADVGIEAFCKGSIVFNILSISLRQCPEISEAGFRMLIQNCRRLRELSLTTNKKMTDQAVTRLREYAGKVNSQHLQINVG